MLTCSESGPRTQQRPLPRQQWHDKTLVQMQRTMNDDDIQITFRGVVTPSRTSRVYMEVCLHRH